MIIFLIYFLCIYSCAEVEAKVFLNSIYTNTNKLDKYYANPSNIVEGTRDIKQDTIEFQECIKTETKEECLKRIKPSELVRRLSKYPLVLDKDYIRDSSEDNEKFLYGNNHFSQDYLDIKDLLRSNLYSHLKHPLIKQKPKKTRIFKILRPNSDKFTFDLSQFRRNTKKKKVYDSDESESSSSESQEAIRINPSKKVAKNKRFQIIDNSMESESESASSDEIKIKKKSKKGRKNKENLMYMQSPSRLYEARRRLPHFLPKRYHWNEDDIRDLRDYWFSGPQGKYWGTV